jgi:hypothetical protein
MPDIKKRARSVEKYIFSFLFKTFGNTFIILKIFPIPGFIFSLIGLMFNFGRIASNPFLKFGGLI